MVKNLPAIFTGRFRSLSTKMYIDKAWRAGKNTKHIGSPAGVDLERNPDWPRVFEGNPNAGRIRADLEILAKQKIAPGATLLFMHGVQTCLNALKSLRYFFEDTQPKERRVNKFP
jgi:hypothetical protein